MVQINQSNSHQHIGKWQLMLFIRFLYFPSTSTIAGHTSLLPNRSGYANLFSRLFSSIDAIDEFRTKHFDGNDGDGNDGGGGLYTALKIVRK